MYTASERIDCRPSYAETKQMKKLVPNVQNTSAYVTLKSAGNQVDIEKLSPLYW